MVGSHEELYRSMETDRVDLVLNDQRRAFSDRYNNEILAESRMYIEISSRNTLGRLEMIDVAEVKNIPCILMIHPASQKEAQTYCEDISGIKGDYLFADSVQEARLKIITGQGYMPVDVIGDPVWSDSTIDRIPLVRNGDPVRKTYCAFWRKDNSGYYNCLTYAFFIAICLSSINATIFVFNCSKHAALCFFRGSLINAIAKLWHFHTII